MKLNNESDRVKREVLARVARTLYAGTPEALDRIPLDMRPKNKPFSRCCIYKDRAALRYRVMAALGFREEDETDELKPLAAYAAEVPARTRNPEPFISILSEGCSACLESQTTRSPISAATALRAPVWRTAPNRPSISKTDTPKSTATSA